MISIDIEVFLASFSSYNDIHCLHLLQAQTLHLMALEVAMEADHPLMGPHHMEEATTVDHLHILLPQPHQTLPQEVVDTITHHHLMEVVAPQHQSLLAHQPPQPTQAPPISPHPLSFLPHLPSLAPASKLLS